MMRMTIREATRKDAEWILHHRRNMFRESGVSDETLDETEKMTKRYLTTDWTEDFRYFLIEENSDIIGGCGLSIFKIPPFSGNKTGLMSYIFNMYIEPSERGRGLGRALMNHVIGVCLKEGIGLAILHASELGRNLYGTSGFVASENLMHRVIREGKTCFDLFEDEDAAFREYCNTV
jgi:GNAT superfamily N-acetyltransferase